MTVAPLSGNEFLERFFSAPNRIPLTDITADDGKWRHVRPWANELLVGSASATVLPCWREERITWYGLAVSEAQFIALREDLLAFVGPTFSTFRGQRAVLNPADPVDAAVFEFTSGLAFKFTGPSPRDNSKASWERLEVLRPTRARRPIGGIEMLRPTGRVLRDFYMALRAGNAEAAESDLSYLQERSRLGPANVLFLRVQAFAQFGHWEKLLRLPEIPDLLNMRRPLAVTEALMRAVYRTELQGFEVAPDPDGALEQFRVIVKPRYDALFTRRSGIRAPEAAKLFVMHAASGGAVTADERASLLVVSDLSIEDREYIALLGKRLKDVKAPFDDPLAMALGEAETGKFDLAFLHALEAPPSIRRARLLVVCAYELQSLDAEGKAVAAILSLSDVDRASALSGRHYREMYHRLIGRAGDTGVEAFSEAGNAGVAGERAVPLSVPAVVELLPMSWTDLLRRLEREPTWSRATEIARRGALEWSIDELLTVPRGAQVLAEALSRVQQCEAVHESVPHLLGFLQRDSDWPRREFASVYSSMLEVLSLSSTGSDDDLIVFYELLEALLGFGASESEYEELIGYCRYLLTAFDSFGRIGWGLDLLDLMIIHPCPRHDLRTSLLADLAGVFQRYRRRLEPLHWELLRTLSAELHHGEVYDSLVAASGAQAPVEAAAASNTLERLKGRSVAIYTLTESVGQRVQDFLRTRAPGVDVHFAKNKVGDERLRQLARNADIFIVATASAKHAATEFIDANRPKDDPRRVTIRPAGKGSASMLRALYTFLSQGSGAQ